LTPLTKILRMPLQQYHATRTLHYCITVHLQRQQLLYDGLTHRIQNRDTKSHKHKECYVLLWQQGRENAMPILTAQLCVNNGRITSEVIDRDVSISHEILR